jgi:hypothetical protein
VDANKEKSVALAARLGIAPSTLNTIVYSRKDTEKCYAQCGRLSGQRKSLKQSPFEELETLLAAWFKQARGSNAVISGTLLRERALLIATRLGIEDFKASNGWINCFKQRHSVVYKTVSGECKSVDSSTVDEWRKKQFSKFLRVTNLRRFIMLMRLGCSSGFHLTRH